MRARSVGLQSTLTGTPSHAVPRLTTQPPAAKTSLQFIRGIEEASVPDVRLTRSVDGSNGTAFFRFDGPSIFTVSDELGDITGLYMVDEEGEMQTVEVRAKFINGKPEAIEAKYYMKTPLEWDRFMRFMERYAEEHGLGFEKGKK